MNSQLNKHKILNYAGTLAAGIILGWLFFSAPGVNEDQHKHETTNRETIWTCSMHPQVRLPASGKCPICAMDLIPVSTSSLEETSMNQDGIQMSESALNLANIQTSIVKSQAPENTLYLFGRIKEDERNIAKITARFGGRIEALHINFTGQQVKKNQILGTIYSPELLTTQKELIEAIKLKNTNPSFYLSVRRKLELWGISEEQINQIENNRDPIVYFNIVSPIRGTVTKRQIRSGEYITEGSELFEVVDLSKIWVIFEAYEHDLSWIRLNDIITFDIPALPKKSYEGKITYINPFLDPVSRIVKVRVELSNPSHLLKPEMYVNGVLKSTNKLDQYQLLIPKSSVLWTGKRAIVYVRDQKSTAPRFLYREINLGPQAGDAYIVLKGLKEGEEIVTHGVFKVDAASQLAGHMSMMNQDSRTTHLIHAGHIPNKNNDLASHAISDNLKSDSF